ncbi:MAG: hypothetical protein Tsb0033_17960 [Winogradskyella sp.]
MNDITYIYGRIPDKFFSIKKSISNWNYENISGIGQKRGHDKYAIIELNIYTIENYPNKELLNERYPNSIGKENYLNNSSVFIWRVSEAEFPKSIYENGKQELIESIRSTIDIFSFIKKQKLNLVFEITWAGYGMTDAWGKGAVSMAFTNAILSCFDKKLYEKGMNYKNKYQSV